MQHQYNIGDKVVITGNTISNPFVQHHFEIGTICTIRYSETVEGCFCLRGVTTLHGFTSDQYVMPCDFRPASDELRALRDDEQYRESAHTETSF